MWGLGEERKRLLQAYCYGSALSTSLPGFGDVFPWLLGLLFLQNYVAVTKKKKRLLEMEIAPSVTQNILLSSE